MNESKTPPETAFVRLPHEKLTELINKISATNRYTDLSTKRYFRYVFYCEGCGKAISSMKIKYRTSIRKKPFYTKSEKIWRTVDYESDQLMSFEMANLEMKYRYISVCGICGASICSDCAIMCEDGEDEYIVCEKCWKQHGLHGRKMNKPEKG